MPAVNELFSSCTAFAYLHVYRFTRVLSIMKPSGYYDAVHWHIGEIVSRVIAESGRASDRHHLGKIVLQSLKDRPDFILQIDGATGEEETCGSVLKRSVQCAVAIKKLGLVSGDVVLLMAPNHLDLCIPFYAALYLGVGMSAINEHFKESELKHMFGVAQPKLIFCQSNKAPHVQHAIKELGLRTHVVTFDKGDQLLSFTEFLERYGVGADVDSYRAEDFDPEETLAWLISTSGTTGLPKVAATTHKSVAINTPYIWSGPFEFPYPVKLSFVLSPLQWLTAIANYILSPILGFTRLQSSSDMTQEHAYYLINKYKPTFVKISPTMMTTLIKPGDCDKCDFTCFEFFTIGGSAVSEQLIEDVKQKAPKAEVYRVYGVSELSTIGFNLCSQMPKSCGKPSGCFQYRVCMDYRTLMKNSCSVLVDIATQKDILEPNVSGELWLKGPGIFKGYYNNPTATKETFAEGGWFKTGDLFYRDDNWNFYFVERAKLLLKYRSHQISPLEIEDVIRQHPGVLDVAVTGLPDPEFGDLPLACVVLNAGHHVTAQEIKDLVKDNLTDTKQLRGGVIFLPEMPLLNMSKINRGKLKEIALSMAGE